MGHTFGPDIFVKDYNEGLTRWNTLVTGLTVAVVTKAQIKRVEKHLVRLLRAAMGGKASWTKQQVGGAGEPRAPNDPVLGSADGPVDQRHQKK